MGSSALVPMILLACIAADGASSTPNPDPVSPPAPRERPSSSTAAEAPHPIERGPGAAPLPLGPESAVPPSTLSAPDTFWELGDAACGDGGRLVRPSSLAGRAVTVYCASDALGTSGPYATLREGRPQEIGVMVAGEREGIWRRFYPEGKLAREEQFYKGKLHGTSRDWSTGGVLVAQSEHRAGRPWGEWVRWDEAGRELSRSTLVDGTGILTLRTSTDTIVTPYVHGLEHGEQRAEDAKGRLTSTVEWAGGEKHGVERTWHDGVPTAVRSWRRGERHGAETVWIRGEESARSRWYLGKEIARVFVRDGVALAELPAPTACDADGTASAIGRDRPAGADTHQCVLREPLLPDAVRVGSFAYDRGCRSVAWVVGCERTEVAPSATDALRAAGWAKATPAQREALVTAAIDLYLLGFEASRSGAPKITHGADGSLDALGSAKGDSGMSDKAPTPVPYQVRVTADGTWTPSPS